MASTWNKLLCFYCFVCLSFVHESESKLLDRLLNFYTNEKGDVLLPNTSIGNTSRPLIPLLAPSPLTPFTNNSVPKMSGLCALNFTAVKTLISTTAVDCSAGFAPYLANVVCCPQLHATLVILSGQLSKVTRSLGLEKNHAKHCLSDLREMLISQGANENIEQICSVGPSSLTQSSCPVKDLNEFENFADAKMLLAACRKVDAVGECCSQICQNEIFEAAIRIASKDPSISVVGGSSDRADYSSRIGDCRKIVLAWLASKLDLLSAKQMLRRLSNCSVNKVCPLVFPSSSHLAKNCKGAIENQTACCKAMEYYISSLQKQTFITNLQALHCTSLLGRQLWKVNITENVYNMCDITLKDFSLQIGSQESGCLLPSLPMDATFDQISGISFTCDLNDNIEAPWPSSRSEESVSSCKKTVRMPALPAATSAVRGTELTSPVVTLLLAFVLATIN